MTCRPQDTLEHLLGSRARSGVIRTVFRRRADRLWFRQIFRESGGGRSGVWYELEVLVQMGLLTRQREGGACFFLVNEAHPLAEVLYSLVERSEALDWTHWWLIRAAESPPRIR